MTRELAHEQLHLAIFAALLKRERDLVKGKPTVQERSAQWNTEGQDDILTHQSRRLTLVELILAVLEIRGVTVDARSEAHIRDCEELAVLERWGRRVREVASASELCEQG